MRDIFNKVLMVLFVSKIFSASQQDSTQRHKLFFLQKSVKSDDEDVLLKVVWTEKGEEKILEGCKTYAGKSRINRTLKSAKNPQVRTLPEAEMNNLLRDCKEFNIRMKQNEKEAENHNVENTSTNHIKIIFPGTKWCGLGDIAEDYNDLGSDSATDKCCREHDQCKEYLPPGETIDNLINTSWMPLLGCKCDHDFYECLTKVNSVSSKTILNLYFNILNKECFELDYPLTNQCKSYYTFLKIVCSEYERNTTAPKVYKVIPVKKYKVAPVLGPLTTEGTQTTPLDDSKISG